MPSTPRIVRALPDPDHTTTHPPRPVIARLRWRHLSRTEDVRALTLATSPGATLIRWIDDHGHTRDDWIPTDDIRDPGAPWNDHPHRFIELFPPHTHIDLSASTRPGPPLPEPDRRADPPKPT